MADMAFGMMSDAMDGAIERMKTAAGKEEHEAKEQKVHVRAFFCDGQAHGLRAAIRMLLEERAAAEAEPRAVADARDLEASADDDDVMTAKELLGGTLDELARKVRTRAGDSADALDAAMERAPEVDWLTPEQLAESDEALHRLRTGRAHLVQDADRAAVLGSLVGPPTNVFHTHLDTCERCTNRPWDLCPIGAKALAESATGGPR